MEKAVCAAHPGFAISVPERNTSNDHFASRTEALHPMQARASDRLRYMRNLRLGILPNDRPTLHALRGICYVHGIFRELDPARGEYWPMQLIADNAGPAHNYLNLLGDPQIVRLAAQRDVGGTRSLASFCLS